MTPITPVELREGTVIGKERILTAVSGTFAWPEAARPRCLRFDLRDLPVEGGFEVTPAANGWTVKVALQDWAETAVVEAAGE
jgi:hypothetical protein